MSEPILLLKPEREKSVLHRHPWIFSGAVAELRGEPANGATVSVRSSAGEFLARAAYSPQSQIVARVWSWDENEAIDESFLRRKIARAVEHRQRVFSKHPQSSAYRLVNAESDGLPGLVVDRYADFLVCQF
ncbi:MAG: 23S rRNA (cytosine(1962)-C(5))-methyltransferase RlmI, partial [Chloroflexota bacterium]